MTRALVFDSGVGGLTIADELRKAAPDWIVDYAADSGFFPYGVKTDDELRERLPRLCAALVDVAKPDVLVIACNTASTLSLDAIRATVKVPVVGTVPAIKPAAEQTKTGTTGALADFRVECRAHLAITFDRKGDEATANFRGAVEPGSPGQPDQPTGG